MDNDFRLDNLRSAKISSHFVVFPTQPAFNFDGEIRSHVSTSTFASGVCYKDPIKRRQKQNQMADIQIPFRCFAKNSQSVQREQFLFVRARSNRKGIK